MRSPEEYKTIIILFDDGQWTEYEGHSLVTVHDYLEGQMVIGIRADRIIRILKNRWGNKT